MGAPDDFMQGRKRETDSRAKSKGGARHSSVHTHHPHRNIPFIAALRKACANEIKAGLTKWGRRVLLIRYDGGHAPLSVAAFNRYEWRGHITCQKRRLCGGKQDGKRQWRQVRDFRVG
jgi:hypothetical protein